MNKLITTDLGGFPFALDDIRWQQDATFDAIKGIISTWGLNPADTYILSGCTVTPSGGNLNVAAGYIAINGEVCKVNAHTVAINSVNYWDFKLNFDPNGLKTFESGSSYNTYQIREAEVKGAASLPAGYVVYTSTKTLETKITEAVNLGLDGWTYINMEENFTFQAYQNSGYTGLGTNSLPSENFKAGSYYYYNIIGNTVFFNFNLNNIVLKRFDTDGAIASIVLTLPSELIFDDTVTQYATYDTQSTTHGDAAGGISSLVTIPNQPKIALQLTTPGGKGLFNRTYELAASPSKNWAQTSITNIFVGWNFRGSVAFKLKA